LSCGSKDVKVDSRIAKQLVAHLYVINCDDPIFIQLQAVMKEYAKDCHRATELGL
jgi:hypothetical protein